MPLLVTNASGDNQNGYGSLLAFDWDGKPLGAFSADLRFGHRSRWRRRPLWRLAPKKAACTDVLWPRKPTVRRAKKRINQSTHNEPRIVSCQTFPSSSST